MQTPGNSRPRPVTATVTKPRWMQTPTQDALRRIRSKSLESNGSTASLTSLLDHASYSSTSDIEGIGIDRVFDVTYSHSEAETQEQQVVNNVGNRFPSGRRAKSKSPNNNLSAWELWIIEKAKSEQQRKQIEKLKKKQEQDDKEKKEQEKRARMLKAETTRSLWLQRKNEEMHIQKKIEKLRIQEEKQKKEEIDAQVKKRAAEKFDKWQELKKEEEKERIKKIKEEKKERKRLQFQRKLAAEEKFQQWLKMAQIRPKTAPNSCGYISGKLTGYHDCSAYPEPTFYNPVPWQPTLIPSAQSVEKTNKMKPYRWNPEKYL